MQYQTKWQQALINQAVGDALGYPLEFLRPATPRDLAQSAQAKELLISDDTQMTLFTCQSINSGRTIESSYVDWYRTQVGRQPISALGAERLMQASRVPGTTTMDALSELADTISSKTRGYPLPETSGNGCGGLMRVSPYAFAYGATDAVVLALKAARVTHHGWKSDWAVVAYMALLQGLLYRIDAVGSGVLHVVGQALPMTDQRYKAIRDTWEKAIRAKRITDIGQGFYADECLLMGLWAAINCERDYMLGIQHATCHDGDSDSVAAVAGTIMGAMGIAAPAHLFDKVVEAPIIRRYFELTPYESRANPEVGRGQASPNTSRVG